MSHHQNNGQNGNIKVANKASGNLAKLKYLQTTVPDQMLLKGKLKAY
jgi:hypothetical protein